ncbi:CobW family GTP-binding protein [Alkalihalobacterium chitinilyticum]|uniref:GTP-binding protein n=1 Tax=Alkalihalobacterium chitinilyticum TaxID=2980103 RepID=A0ABT5VC91_9BACI|nr:GTP-binding protein [Alkalihalobacterium chitinilyticum]MDE5412093.1 GTP-binding protein [Alkalihalobacterium chitinilyticum]
MAKIPVFVLSGFLGSGKTTLLLRLLEECSRRHLKPAVLMNELGSTDTDGAIISNDRKEQVVEKLLDGCICCNKKGEVVASIEKLLLQKPDVIFIELTGVANPEEVADSLTEPQFIDRLSLQQVITLLDAENVLDYNSIFEADRNLVETVKRQTEVADLLVINKIDLVDSTRITKINKILRKQNNKAEICFTNYSEIDLDPVLKSIQQKRPRQEIRVTFNKKSQEGKQEKHEHKKSYSRIQTISLPIPQPIREKEIEKFLKKYKSSILRAKGYIPLAGKNQTYLMQHVVKRTSWEPTTYTGQHYLVVIGIDLNKEELTTQWKKVMQCQAPLVN